jgi:hypothetical protein
VPQLTHTRSLSHNSARTPRWLLSGALVATLLCPLTSSIALAQAQPPRSALITAVRGRDIILDIGTQQGAARGAVYGIAREGRVRARVQIIEARPAESTARILDADDDFIISVGDSPQFIAVQDVPATLEATPVQPATPSEPATPIEPAPQPETPEVTVGTPEVPGPQPGAGSSAANIPVVAMEGTSISLGGGANRGVRSGSKVPIVRNGDVVAIARIVVVEESRAQGEIVWADEAAGGARVGDSGQLLGGGGSLIVQSPTDATVSGEPAAGEEEETPGVPAARVRYETGASNAVVPFADETYELLGALAASKLITRYSAQMFHDEGSRAHRTEEDITFSRAQIGGLVREAIEAAQARGEDSLTRRERAALAMLSSKFREELQVLGVASEVIDALQPSRFVFGLSGQQRASFVTGSARNGGNEPFSERQGGRRTKSGIDTRSNIFGQFNPDLKFFAQFYGGTKSRTGGDGGFEINRLFLDYNANRLLRGLSVRVGRDQVWWGPGHFGTLLLSDVAGPLNTIQTSFKRGSYELQGLYAPLDRGPLGGRRSLYGHNLSVKVGPQARVGIAETLLLPQDRIDPIAFASAFSPIPLFTVERLRKRNTAVENGNALAKAYLETSLARGVRGWGELLIDDVGVNQNNLVRNRVGTLVGAHFFTPRDPAKLGLVAEYANLQGRTYLGLRALNDADYFYRGAPLGYPVAPLPGSVNGGAESLRFEAYWRPQAKLRLSAGLELADLNSEDATRSRQQVYRLRAAYDIGRNLTAVVRAQRVSTNQLNFTLGLNSRQNLLQFEIVRSY